MRRFTDLPASSMQLSEAPADLERVTSFLDRDFQTRAFARARAAGEGLLQVEDYRGQPLHLGLFTVELGTCTDAARAAQAVADVRRSNFRLPVLTRFGWLQRGRSLIFVSSETPRQPEVAELITHVAELLPPDPECQVPR